jgi:hypothetical protein
MKNSKKTELILAFIQNRISEATLRQSLKQIR